MALIEFGDTDEQTLVVMRGLMQTMHNDLYGNGREGMLKTVSAFMTTFDAVEEEREKAQALRHQENKDKLDRNNFRLMFFGSIIALFSLVCAICMVYLAIKAASHAKADPSDLFHSQIPRLTAER